MLAWELPKHGWELEVLTPRASEIRQDAVDKDSEDFFPTTVPIHEVGSFWRRGFEMVGSRTHAWRTFPTVYRRGSELLATKDFGLVYFSTTTFVYFAIGRRWLKRFGVPYVLDFHDPWLKERAPNAPPSGKWSRRLAERLLARLEREAVTHAAGLVSVSPRYIEVLRRRYEVACPAWLAAKRHAVIPFGALESDLNEARRLNKGSPKRERDTIRIIYAGAGGQIMIRAFTLICQGLAKLRNQNNPMVDRARIELFGTTYGWREGDVKRLEQVAVKHNVGDLVKESPQRVSYRQSLELLLEADGALILGVNDEGYMPSKLFSYALSGQPLLASLRRESPAYSHFQGAPALGHAIWFDAQSEMTPADVSRAVAAFLEEAAAQQTIDRRGILEPYLAPAMARRHAELFEACLSKS